MLTEAFKVYSNLVSGSAVQLVYQPADVRLPKNNLQFWRSAHSAWTVTCSICRALAKRSKRTPASSLIPFFFSDDTLRIEHESFCNQVKSDALVSHTLLRWKWWEVSSHRGQQQNGSTLLPAGKMSHMFPLSTLWFSACTSLFSSFSSSQTTPAWLSQPCEAGSVCHITCVFALVGMCGGLLMMVFTGFRSSSEGSHTNDIQPLHPHL